MSEHEKTLENEAESTSEEWTADAETEVLPGAEEALPQIDLNTASVEELQRLPGIGPVLAERIVQHRVEEGPFADPADIMAVSGLAEDTYAGIADRLTVSVAELEPTGPEDELAGEEPGVEAEAEVAVEAAGPAEPELDEAEGALAEEAAIAVEAAALAEAEPEELEEAVVPEAEAEAVEPAAAELAAEEVSEVPKPPRGPEPPLVEVVPARVGWGRFLFMGLLSTILGAALALAFLYMVNGTLDFRSAASQVVGAEVERLEGEIDALNARLEQAEADLAAMQELDARLTEAEASVQKLADELGATRADLESMAGTMDNLRQEFTNLREDLDGLAEHQSRLEARLLEAEDRLAMLRLEIDTLQRSARRFSAFLDGLRELLGESEGTLRPTPTPWIAPTATPAPLETPTLRPMVTVIPLASPTPTP